MERDDQTIIGWKSFKAMLSLEDSLVQESECREKRRSPCKRERLCDGCYVASVDFDKLDQQ